MVGINDTGRPVKKPGKQGGDVFAGVLGVYDINPVRPAIGRKPSGCSQGVQPAHFKAQGGDMAGLHLRRKLTGDIIGKKTLLAALTEDSDEIFHIFFSAGLSGKVNEVQNIRVGILPRLIILNQYILSAPMSQVKALLLFSQ